MGSFFLSLFSVCSQNQKIMLEQSAWRWSTRNSKPLTRRRAANCMSSRTTRNEHAEIWVVYAKKLVWYANAKICLQGDAGQKGTGQTGSQRPGGDSGWSFCSVHERCFLHLHIHVCTLWFLSSPQAKELQTLHNLRKLFVQDLATRVKKVQPLCTHSSLNYSR